LGQAETSRGSHPKWRQVCTLDQKDLEIEKLSVAFSNTSTKLLDLSIVLDDSTLLPELRNHVQISGVNVYFVIATTIDKGGVDAETLANNWGIGIEAAKRTRLVTTQRGIARMIHPSLTKRFKTNDRQPRYHRLYIT
jgi:hypothetical protein